MTDISAPLRRPKIPVWRTAYEGYRLGIGAIFSSGAMLRFFVYGSLLWSSAIGIYYYDAISNALARRNGTISAEHSLIAETLVALLVALVVSAVQAPLGIALQRRILLGESPNAYYFAYVLSPAGRRFVFVAFTIQVLFISASLMQLLVVTLFGYNPANSIALGAAFRADRFLLWTVMLMGLLFYLVAYWLSTRLSFEFPATACGRQSGSILPSLAETKGTGVRLFFLYIIIFLPMPVLFSLMLVGASITYAMRHYVPGLNPMTDPNYVSGVFLSPEIIVAGGIVIVGLCVSFVAMAAAAARAYQIRIERGMSGVAEIFS